MYTTDCLQQVVIVTSKLQVHTCLTVFACADGLQDALNLRSLNLAGNPTKDLAVVRILELLHVLPTLVDVQLDMRKAAEASAHDLLSTLKRDELRCIMLRKACQHRITPGL